MAVDRALDLVCPFWPIINGGVIGIALVFLAYSVVLELLFLSLLINDSTTANREVSDIFLAEILIVR